VLNYDRILNPTITAIKPSGIRKFFDIAETMQDVISLGVGEPDFPTPWRIRKAGINSLQDGKTRYTSNKGLEKLRQEIAAYVERKYDVRYKTEEVIVTVGGSEAIDAAIRAIIAPGDEVIIPQPSYVCYEPITALAGGVPVIVETKAEDDFKLTPAQLLSHISPRTKALILPYPCNPTGGIMEKEDLEAIAEILREREIIVISDEIYAELTYGGKRHVSIASLPGMQERTILINGFSKAFSMTGWRMGYACGPEPLMQQILKIHQ
jgi:aminotransferase